MSQPLQVCEKLSALTYWLYLGPGIPHYPSGAPLTWDTVYKSSDFSPNLSRLPGDLHSTVTFWPCGSCLWQHLVSMQSVLMGWWEPHLTKSRNSLGAGISTPPMPGKCLANEEPIGRYASRRRLRSRAIAHAPGDGVGKCQPWAFYVGNTCSLTLGGSAAWCLVTQVVMPGQTLESCPLLSVCATVSNFIVRCLRL
jgi:hypothetical protein